MLAPILHDSDDWRNLQNQLKQIIEEQAAVKSDLRSAREMQAHQHVTNQEWLKNLDKRIETVDTLVNGNEEGPGIRTQIEIMTAYGKAAVVGVKVIAWLLVFIVLAGTGYAAWFEAHHKVSEVPAAHTTTENAGPPAIH